MFVKHHTRGIVISSRNEGGNSKRVSLFTEKMGLLSARAQGARSPQSRLRSNIQDFSSGEFSLLHGKSGWRLVGARTDKNLFEIFCHDPEKLKTVSNILNLVKKLAGEGTIADLFNTVIIFLNFLEKANERDIALAECLTLMRILYILGYMKLDPELTLPLSSSKIAEKDLEIIAPQRARIINLINESLRVV